MSKQLQQVSGISKYEKDAHKFDKLRYKELEEMRLHGEEGMKSMQGVEKVSSALQQSISAKLLNQNYGTQYDVAEFDEQGHVYMESVQAESVKICEREIPELPYDETKLLLDSGLEF